MSALRNTPGPSRQPVGFTLVLLLTLVGTAALALWGLAAVDLLHGQRIRLGCGPTTCTLDRAGPFGPFHTVGRFQAAPIGPLGENCVSAPGPDDTPGHACHPGLWVTGWTGAPSGIEDGPVTDPATGQTRRMAWVYLASPDHRWNSAPLDELSDRFRDGGSWSVTATTGRSWFPYPAELVTLVAVPVGAALVVAGVVRRRRAVRSDEPL